RSMACRGYALSRLKLHPEAIRCYQEAIKAGFNSAEVFNNLGCSHSQISELSQARTELTRAIQKNDALQAAYFNRALVHYKMAKEQENLQQNADRERDAGKADIDRAIAVGPASVDLYRKAALLNKKQAARYSQQARDLASKPGQALQRTAMLVNP